MEENLNFGDGWLISALNATINKRRSQPFNA